MTNLTFDEFKSQYNLTDELSQEPDKKKRKMLYYAAIKPNKYGYFVATGESARNIYLQDRYNDYLTRQYQKTWSFKIKQVLTNIKNWIINRW